jgi:hypothetical protein
MRRRGSTIEQVLYRGRWAVAKLARIYLQTARGRLIQQQVPPHLHQCGDELDKVLIELLLELWDASGSRAPSGAIREALGTPTPALTTCSHFIFAPHHRI